MENCCTPRPTGFTLITKIKKPPPRHPGKKVNDPEERSNQPRRLRVRQKKKMGKRGKGNMTMEAKTKKGTTAEGAGTPPLVSLTWGVVREKKRRGHREKIRARRRQKKR